MTREEREQLLKDTLLYFAPKDHYVIDEEGNVYYREDVTLKAMKLSEQPLPPAEGAEEFLLAQRNGNDNPITVAISPEGWIFKMVVKAMERFATLHAHKIADKMVSERLRDELESFAIMFNGKDNTYKFITYEHIDEYLKIRERDENK